MSDTIRPLCAECLRICIDDHQESFRPPSSTYTVANNMLWGNYQPTVAYYCVDGTYYCGEHAIEAYRAVREHNTRYLIEEAL